MIIAVDFDGTIVEHRYPQIGREIPFAISTIKQLQKEGHMLILWTVRQGNLLQEAIDFCSSRGLEFYAVNANHPDEEISPDQITPCRKMGGVDIFIDDRNVGGLPDWGVIYEMVHNNWTYRQYLQNVHSREDDEPKSFWKKFLG